MSDKPNKESAGKTLLVAFLLCVGCSIVVATAAVGLRPIQEENRLVDLKKNVLAAAGVLQEGDSKKEITAKFEDFEAVLVDFETDYYATEAALNNAGVTVESYDQKKAAKDPALSMKLDGKQDIASIKRQAKFAKVYLLKNSEGQLEKIILPIHGYGLWSTLYGFVALQGDLNTVAGLGFYAHAETPGLGGEVDNPKWKDQWPGKKIYAEDGSVQATVVKAKATPGSDSEVDGLSGATLTTRGVDNLVKYWMGEHGFGPFLDNISGDAAPQKVDMQTPEIAPAVQAGQTDLNETTVQEAK